MCLRLILATLATVFFASSCNSTKTSPGSGGGGSGGASKRNPYLYPVHRLGTPKTVKTSSVDGRFVFLDDGSIWNVNWSDASDAARWRPGEPVSISRSGSSSYPYVISAKSGGSVSARYGKKLD